MNDRIELRRLQIDTVIGVYEWERGVRQRLYLDLDLPTDAAVAIEDLAKTVDYDAVAKHVRAFAAAARHELIETFADTLARDLLVSFRLPWIELVIAKPGAVADCADVRLCIRRDA
ncbi:MAG: dihydroneopterin aldolase [Pseudomonadota bacterium]|nr:dihydroneopterin aldolase [Pseudomonadota bacterium]